MIHMCPFLFFGFINLNQRIRILTNTEEYVNEYKSRIKIQLNKPLNKQKLLTVKIHNNLNSISTLELVT